MGLLNFSEPETGAFTSGGNGATIDIDWTSTPFQGIYEFSTDGQFDLFFTDYRNDTADEGFFGVRTDPGWSDHQRRRHSLRAATSPFDGDCQVISEVGATGPLAGVTTEVDTEVPLFAGLAAGDYIIGLRDSATPAAGGVSFEVAAVPLPAGLVLFLSGIGLLGFVSRRKA